MYIFLALIGVFIITGLSIEERSPLVDFAMFMISLFMLSILMFTYFY